jgi:hypothetical protein
MAATKKWKQLVKRWPKKSYGVSMDQNLLDTRLDTGLSMVAKGVEGLFLPASIPGGNDIAVVLGIVPYDAPHMSSRDPKLGILANSDKNQTKRLGLKCYVLSRPMCIHVNIDKVGTLDPKYIALLPTFDATILCGDALPLLGDIVEVKYDNLFHTKGDFVKITGDNVYDILCENASNKSLVSQFKAGSKKSPVSSWGDAAGVEERRLDRMINE